MTDKRRDAKHDDHEIEDKTAEREDVVVHDDDKEETTQPNEIPAEPVTHQDKKQNWFKRCWHWLLTHKKFSIPVILLMMLAVLAIIPFTRYLIAGTVIKQDFQVRVVDAETAKPISSVTIVLRGETVTTDNEGRATIRANVGHTNLDVSKKYYESSTQDVLIPLKKSASPHEVKLKATGRAVPVTVVNKISKKATPNVTVKAVDEDTEVKTGDDGKATLVVPADKQELKISLSGEGFNGIDAMLIVTTDEIPTNTFEVTTSGKIYFLSNASGKIDLIKSNLDGTDRQTVLAGTGKEDRQNTVLLASRDWKYIALLSRRDGGEYDKLFLVETDTDKLTTMDEGEATFNVYGWSGDRFIYKVNRDKKKDWEAGRQALKSYNASAKKITTLVETAVEGNQNNYAYEYFGWDSGYVSILGEEVIYAKNWGGGRNCYYCTWVGEDNRGTLNSIKADGSQKKEIKSYIDKDIATRTAEFGEIYILFEQDGSYHVDEYHDGKVVKIDQKEDEFYNEFYPYYSVSPTDNKTLWSENRDGKNALFVGDGNGENGKEIGRSDEYTVYGWFTDDYVLLTKKGSEMHIIPADGLEGGVEKALKISDYYKPGYYSPQGFGYGYGR